MENRKPEEIEKNWLMQIMDGQTKWVIEQLFIYHSMIISGKNI